MTSIADQTLAGRSDGDLLIEFVSRRDEPAFAEIVRRHGGLVMSVCRSALGNSPDAEDAAQAVFLTLAQRASSLKGRTTLAGWLYRVAWYVAVRAAEAKAIRCRHEQEAARMKASASTSEEPAIPPDMLYAALADLPEKHRLPLLLHHLEGRSEQETARLLGCGVRAASMRLNRGREFLRERLTKRGLAGSAAGAVAVMASQASAGVVPAFVTAASQAAVTMLAGKTATAASAAAVALSKGALNMLFWTKMKLAAMLTAAALLVGGAGVATYVVAADNPAVPPAVVPATQPATQPADLSSKPVVNNGLQVTVILPKAAFAADEPLKFTVHFKNVSEKAFILNDVDSFWDWTMQFDDVARNGPWQLHLTGAEDLKQAPRPAAPRLCKPGETVEVIADFRHFPFGYDFSWQGQQGQTVLPIKQLQMGKYGLTMKITLKEGPRPNMDGKETIVPYWAGTITTDPVEFEISDKAAATQPAPRGQPVTVTGTIGKPDANVDTTATAIGHSGVLLIGSQDRWDEINKLMPELTPDTPLPKVDFAKQAVVLIYAIRPQHENAMTLSKSDLAANPPQLDFLLRWDNRPMGAEWLVSTKFILAVIPAAPMVKVTLSSLPDVQDKVGPANLEFSAVLGGKDGGDIVDGLRAAITPKSATIKPGEDIPIEIILHLADPGDAKPQQLAVPKSVFVWDGVFSKGYRNHAFFVTTPDGKTTLLRPKEKEFAANIPHPVEIPASRPYHLIPNFGEGDAHKSLQELGLDTSAPGIYTITGLYEETAGNGGDDAKTPMWGGSITSNTITVEVK